MTVYGATLVSGCVHCHQIVFRGADDIPWRTLRGYAACPRNDGPHEVPDVVRGCDVDPAYAADAG